LRPWPRFGRQTAGYRAGEWSAIAEGEGFRIHFFPHTESDLDFVEAPAKGGAVIGLRNGGHVRIRGIDVCGGVKHGVEIKDVEDVEISWCRAYHNGHVGITMRAATNCGVRNCVSRFNEYGITESFSRHIAIEENDVAYNGVDGIIASWKSDDILIKRNYVHDHLLWGHPDNIQLYRDVTNVRFIENLLIAGGQSVMMEETTKGWLVANWKTNTNFELDLRFREDSPALRLGTDSLPIGSTIDVQEYMRGDFDGDGARNVPSIPPELRK